MSAPPTRSIPTIASPTTSTVVVQDDLVQQAPSSAVSQGALLRRPEKLLVVHPLLY